MKRIVLTIILMAGCWFTITAQSVKEEKLKNSMENIKNKMELKELVDTFSILADRKDIKTQILLFTEDAVVDSYHDGKLVSSLKGRQQIIEGFSSYLALFETVYHINGQQTVTINDDKAVGISYCQVVLIRNENGKRIMNTQGVYYNDEYIHRNGKWLIAKRTSNFIWSDRHEINN